MIDNRFKSGLKKFSVEGKTVNQVKNYLTKKADMLGINIPNYIGNMSKVSTSKVNRFINTLMNRADKEIRKTEIEKIKYENSMNKFKNAVSRFNNKVDKVTNEFLENYSQDQVNFLTGGRLKVDAEEISFDSIGEVILQKMDYNNFEFSDKEQIDLFTESLNKKTREMSYKSLNDELLNDRTIEGLGEYYNKKLMNFLDEFNDLKHYSDFNAIGERYNKLNKIQKNMFVQAFSNNMRDDYPVPTDQEGQDRFETNYVNKLLRIMNDVEGY